jgi:hypothetical protein
MRSTQADGTKSGLRRWAREEVCNFVAYVLFRGVHLEDQANLDEKWTVDKRTLEHSEAAQTFVVTQHVVNGSPASILV